MLNQGRRLHWFCGYDILTCGIQNHCASLHEKVKEKGLSHVLGWSYETGLESVCITLYTFHQLEFSYTATHNGKEEWEMIANFMIKRRLKYFDEHIGSLYYDDFNSNTFFSMKPSFISLYKFTTSSTQCSLSSPFSFSL